MDLEKKMQIMREMSKEIITEEELKDLFETNSHPIAYDGFEPSGLAHMPIGVYRPMNLKQLLKTGIKFKLLLADYHAFANNKLNRNMDLIQKCGKYFLEVWKAAGIDLKKIEIVWASELMDSVDYWDTFIKVGANISLPRAMRAIDIMGRTQQEKLTNAQLFYPAMQVTDVFKLNVDICQLGMDQRRANMLAREVAAKLNKKKPVAVHHHMLLGLFGPREGKSAAENKMSKSFPESSIFVHDSEQEILKKINKALCPEKQIEGNPMIEWSKEIIFKSKNSVTIERDKKFGGTLELQSYEELEKTYSSGKLHPADLKKMVATELNTLIKPVREHFEKNKKAKELYETVVSAQKTR